VVNGENQTNLIRKQVVMEKQRLKERKLGERAGRDLEILGTANLEDLEETLVPDRRGNLRPSQIVDQRLVTLLQTSHPGCWSRDIWNRALSESR
jgi:hypothetical protein